MLLKPARVFSQHHPPPGPLFREHRWPLTLIPTATQEHHRSQEGAWPGPPESTAKRGRESLLPCLVQRHSVMRPLASPRSGHPYRGRTSARQAQVISPQRPVTRRHCRCWCCLAGPGSHPDFLIGPGAGFSSQLDLTPSWLPLGQEAINNHERFFLSKFINFAASRMAPNY